MLKLVFDLMWNASQVHYFFLNSAEGCSIIYYVLIIVIFILMWVQEILCVFPERNWKYLKILSIDEQ